MPKPRPQMDVDQVARFRTHFFEHFTEDGNNEAYDVRDVEKFRTSDEYIHKFLMVNKFDFEVTAEKVNTVFKWRKQIGLNDLTFDSFDEEMLKIGGFYVHNHCKIGRRIVWFKICKYKKDPSKVEVAKKFMAFWLNKVESEGLGDSAVIIMDMTNAGLSNMDLEVIKFMIKCFELYFPALVGIMLVYEMHWVLNAIWKIIEKLLSAQSREHIKFLRGNAIHELIDPDQLPTYMGGTDTWEWSWPLPDTEQDILEEITEEDDLQDASMFSLPNGDVSHQSAEGDRNASADHSPTISPSHKTKRVHFANPVEPDAGDADSGNAPGSDKKRTLRRTSKKPKLNIHKGPLLSIEPGERVVFEEPSPPSEEQPSLIMNLTNTTNNRVAYKIKTTTPDRYKVRPSAGPINPGASIKVTITLLSGDKDSVLRDKFLVQSTELTEVLRTPAELTEFWKRVTRDDIVEHRMRCVYIVSRDSELGIVQLKKDMVTLTSKVDRLAHEVVIIKDSTTALLRLVLLQLVLLINILLYFCLFGQGKDIMEAALKRSADAPKGPAAHLSGACDAVQQQEDTEITI